MGSAKETYIRFANAREDLRIYNMPFWLDAVCGPENWDAVVIEENGRIEAALPYHTGRRPGGTACILQPQMTQCFDLWIRPVPDLKTEKELHRQFALIGAVAGKLLAKGADLYDFNLSSSLHNWQPFAWEGFHEETKYSFVIPKERIGDAWDAMSPSLRADIRRAEAAMQVTDLRAEEIPALRGFLTETLRRQGIANPVSEELLGRIYRACLENQCIKMPAIRQDGRILCAGIYVFDSRYVYELLPGTAEDAKAPGCKALMTWQMISFANETGRGFDFEGSMVPGVAEHDRRFGAELVPYYHLWRIQTKNPLKRLSLIARYLHAF